MVSVEKTRHKKWMKTKVKGRLPTSLVSSHRVEWTVEKPVGMPALLKLNREAEKCKPKKRDPKPVGVWYVIPNRNRMREYTDLDITVQVFPISGTVRILPGHEMAWPELKGYVERAFLMGGLDVEECERLSEQLIPNRRHKTFEVGPVSPFKIDHYAKSLGITISADGSHPKHIETHEDWPSWIKPMLNAFAKQTEAADKQASAALQQTEVNKELAKQIGLHLSVMRGIEKNVGKLDVSTTNLVKATHRLRKDLKKQKYRRKKHKRRR